MCFYKKNDVTQISQLLKSSIDPYDRSDQSDFTLPHRESGFCHNKVANAMTKFRDHVNTVFGIDKLTPLHYACSSGYSKVAKTMVNIDHSTVNVSDINGFTALHYACRYSHIDAVNILLKSGARVNNFNQTYIVPLYASCSNGHLEIVKSLVKFGAIVNTHSPEVELTPLHYACRMNRTNVVKFLL